MMTARLTASAASSWLNDGRRVVAAVLAEIEHSAPLALGATMLVDEHGNVEGSITGGCVESAVVHEAQAVLGGAPARIVRYGISDEVAGTAGLTCGGTVHVIVHALEGPAADAERAVAAAIRGGRPAAIATVLDGTSAGHQLALVDGELVGTVGAPDLLRRSVTRDLGGVLEHGGTTVRRYGADGAVLGAELRVLLRSFAAPPQMLIFGAIDFAAALAPLARELGYTVTIADARETFARSPRFTRAADVVVAWPQDVLASRDLGPRDAVLVFTHDPKFDEPALIQALASGAGYIGALGSRTTTALRNERLRARGVTAQQLARIHGPCGLDIGGRTPEEVAISILAEIVATRTGRSAAPLRATTGAIQRRDG